MECSSARYLLECDHPRAREFDAGEQEALEAHLQSCADCAPVAKSVREADARLARAMQDVPLPPDSPARLLTRLRLDRQHWYRRQVRRWGAAAAAVLLTLGALAGWASTWRTTIDLEKMVNTADARGDSADEIRDWFYATYRVKPSLPSIFKYNYLVSAGLQDYEGKLVPRLLFVHGQDYAEVLILPSRQFKLPGPNMATIASGSRFTVELIATGPDAAYLIQYSGPSRDWLLTADYGA